MYCESGLFKSLHDGIRISDSLFLRGVEDLNKLNFSKFISYFSWVYLLSFGGMGRNAMLDTHFIRT